MTLGSRRTAQEPQPTSYRSSRTNQWRALLLVVLGLGLFGWAAPAAAEQTVEESREESSEEAAPTATGAITLAITNQSPFVAANGSFSVRLSIESVDELPAALDTYELSLTVFGVLAEEAQVDQPASEPINRLEPVPLSQANSTGPNTFQLDMPVRSDQQFDDQDRVLLPSAGVYPVVVELRTTEGPITSARTNLIRLPARSKQGDGGPDRSPVAVVVPIRANGRLTVKSASELFRSHPDLPLTALLEEGVLSQLRSDPALATEFKTALGGRPVVAAPNLDLDPSALAQIDQEALFLSTARSAQAALAQWGFTVSTEIAVADSPLTKGGAQTLADLGVRYVLDTRLGSRPVGKLGLGPNSELQLMRIDNALANNLGALSGPAPATDQELYLEAVRGVHQLLARLALRDEVELAPVIIGGPALGRDPEVALDLFLETMSQAGAPPLVGLTEVAVEDPIPVRPAELPEQDLLPIAQVLLTVQDKLATYEDFYHDGGRSPDDYRIQVLASLDRNRDPAARERSLVLLDAQLDRELSVVDLPGGQPITLAARTAPIPLLVENRANGPRSVMLRFTSDKVVAVDNGQIVVVQPGNSSIDVELEARSLGVSPLEVSVWTPDGKQNLATTRFEVRSTAIPGLGLLAGLSAVGLLIVWWVADAKKRRRVGEPPIEI